MRTALQQAIILALLSPSLFAQWVDPEKEKAAKSEIAYLFDQTQVSGTDEKTLLAEYRWRKLELLTHRQLEETAAFWPQAFIATLIYLSWSRIQPKINQAFGWLKSGQGLAQGSALGLGFAGAQMLGQAIGWLTTKGHEFVSGGFSRTLNLVSSAGDYYFELETRPEPFDTAKLTYAKHKHRIPSRFHPLIEHKLADVIVSNGDEDAKKKAMTYLQNVLRLPTEIRPANPNLNSVAEAFGYYPGKTLSALKRVFAKQISASAADGKSRFPFYFVGPPGTGKTRAAQRIAASLGVPMVAINLDQIKEDELLGSKSHPGIIATQLMEYGQRNLILVLDEVHHALNSKNSIYDARYQALFKRLLDPTKPSYWDEYFEEEIDLSSVDIILAATEVIKDHALRNRMLEVLFEPFPVWYKRHVVWNETVPMELQRYNHSEPSLSIKDLNSTDINAINTLVSNDQESGFRGLQKQIFEYMADLFLKKSKGFDAAYNDTVPFEGALTGPRCRQM